MTGSLLLYLTYQGFALLLCLWAACSTMQDRREHDPLHRVWTLLAAVSLPLGFGLALGGRLGGPPQLLWIEIALPFIAFATTFTAMVVIATSRAPDWRWSVLLALPLVLFSAYRLVRVSGEWADPERRSLVIATVAG